MNISAVVLTHNDGKNLVPTLNSLSWCDELIVIDDSSTDDTADIAKKFKARVLSRPLGDDFATQRNFGLEKATGEWVLFVDSDEVVSPDSKNEILQNIRNSKFSGFYLKRRDYFLGKWLEYGETSRVKLLRLAQKDAGRWERAVHEVWKVTGGTTTLEHPLLHNPHSNVTKFLADINRYSTLNAKVFRRQGIRSNALTILLYPVGKFFRNYVLLAGFRDGTPGAVMALMMSFHSFLTRAKLYLPGHRV